MPDNYINGNWREQEDAGLQGDISVGMHDHDFEMLACTEVVGFPPHNLYFCVCSACIP